MFKTIMVCLDGSKLAEQVLPVAVEMAQRNDGKLVLFRTIIEYALISPNIPGYSGISVQTGNFAKRLEENLELASSYLDSMSELINKETGLTVKVDISLGSPGKSIVEYAENNGIDLVVLATHGHGGLERIVFGSNADYVLKRSPFPNLILRPKSVNESNDILLFSDSPLKKILVCLDGSHLAEQILPYAVEQARLFRSKLVLLRVIQTPVSEVTISPKATAPVAEKENEYYSLEEKEATNYLLSIADSYQQSAIDSEWAIVQGDNPEETIVDYARKNNFDMIAMCTHGRGGLNRLVLGSVADHILRNAEMPLLILKPRHNVL
jgi:nucleotide-binding universal stress UspA family protein